MEMLVRGVVVNIQQRRPPAIRLHFYWRKFAWHKPTRGGEGWGGEGFQFKSIQPGGPPSLPYTYPTYTALSQAYFQKQGKIAYTVLYKWSPKTFLIFVLGRGFSLLYITWVCFTVFHRDPCSIGKVAMHGGRYTVLETWFEVLNKRQRWSLNKKNLVSIIDDQIEALSSQTFSVNDFNE